MWGLGYEGPHPALYIDLGPKDEDNPDAGSKLGKILYDEEKGIWGEGWNPAEMFPGIYTEEVWPEFRITDPPGETFVMEKRPSEINSLDELMVAFPNLKLAEDSRSAHGHLIARQVWPLLKMAYLAERGEVVLALSQKWVTHDGKEEVINIVRFKVKESEGSESVREVFHKFTDEGSVYWTEGWDPADFFQTSSVRVGLENGVDKYEFETNPEELVD